MGGRLLIEEMIVHLDLAVGFEVIWHEHDRDRDIAQLIDLQSKGTGRLAARTVSCNAPVGCQSLIPKPWLATAALGMGPQMCPFAFSVKVSPKTPPPETVGTLPPRRLSCAISGWPSTPHSFPPMSPSRLQLTCAPCRARHHGHTGPALNKYPSLQSEMGH